MTDFIANAYLSNRKPELVMRMNKKLLFVSAICVAAAAANSFAQNKHEEERPTNLKVLPKNITGEELHKIMRGYAMSLGVKCGFCHVSEAVEGQSRPKFDFASDNKQEKVIARKMMQMVDGINGNYIGKIIGTDHALEPITCVTCHMGHVTPIVSVDSLAKK